MEYMDKDECCFEDGDSPSSLLLVAQKSPHLPEVTLLRKIQNSTGTKHAQGTEFYKAVSQLKCGVANEIGRYKQFNYVMCAGKICVGKICEQWLHSMVSPY